MRRQFNQEEISTLKKVYGDEAEKLRNLELWEIEDATIEFKGKKYAASPIVTKDYDICKEGMFPKGFAVKVEGVVKYYLTTYEAYHSEFVTKDNQVVLVVWGNEVIILLWLSDGEVSVVYTAYH